MPSVRGGSVMSCLPFNKAPGINGEVWPGGEEGDTGTLTGRREWLRGPDGSLGGCRQRFQSRNEMQIGCTCF